MKKYWVRTGISLLVDGWDWVYPIKFFQLVSHFTVMIYCHHWEFLFDMLIRLIPLLPNLNVSKTLSLMYEKYQIGYIKQYFLRIFLAAKFIYINTMLLIKYAATTKKLFRYPNKSLVIQNQHNKVVCIDITVYTLNRYVPEYLP